MSERLLKIAPGFVHVYPVGDLREHETEHGGDCWCEPQIELGATFERWAVGADPDGPPTETVADGALVIHQSLDGRERHEGQN